MADSHANEERLRNLREVNRQQRKVETPEQHDEHLKGCREADKQQREAETPKKRCARLDQQKAYHEKKKLLKRGSESEKIGAEKKLSAVKTVF